MIGIVSLARELFKTVGLLAELRLKNWTEKSYFWLKCESRIFDQKYLPKYLLNIYCAKAKLFVATISELIALKLGAT